MTRMVSVRTERSRTSRRRPQRRRSDCDPSALSSSGGGRSRNAGRRIRERHWLIAATTIGLPGIAGRRSLHEKSGSRSTSSWNYGSENLRRTTESAPDKQGRKLDSSVHSYAAVDTARWRRPLASSLIVAIRPTGLQRLRHTACLISRK